MQKSPNDNKHYQAFTLSNGLRVLVIHNADTEKSAAALAVNVGHFDDPADRHGMAHFLEHMLFLGTKKYPDGHEYQKFIGQYGGSHNAWTGTEHTCYFFDIHHSHFEQAIDRFSDFFIQPLLAKEFVEKERKNIDAEYKMKLKDDIRRLYDVHKATINQQHPFAQFSVGDASTLADRDGCFVVDELRQFYQQHYSANLMTLVVEGPQSLEQLQQLVTDKFSDIPSNHQAKQAITEPLYLPEHLGIKINVKPVKNEHRLIISFALPALDLLYRYKPENLLSYLLGHEGKGSILSYLKHQGWALALTAGSGINGSNFKDFNINISLTELGEQYVDDIVTVVFSYIKRLKQPLESYYYQEKQAIANIAFNYQEKLKPLDSVCQLVINMQHYPEQDYIYGDYALDSFEQQQITTLLSYFTPKNMRLIHVSKQLSYNELTHWYQVPFACFAFNEQQLQKWLLPQEFKQLQLPKPNDYICYQPQVFDDEHVSQIPEVLIQDNGLTVWFKQDNTFKVPKGFIYIGIDCPKAIETTESVAMTKLFVELFSHQVVEQYYDAELAGIHYHLYAHQGGLTIQISGLSENQPLLLKALINELFNISFTEQAFDLFKHQLIKHWHNSQKSKSIAQLFAQLSSFMQPNNPTTEQLAGALTKISFEQFQLFSQHLLNNIAIEALIHGNWQTPQAKQLSQIIEQGFLNRCDKKHQVSCPVVALNQQQQLVLPLTLVEHDHACIHYLPFTERSDELTAMCMLTSQILSPLFFQTMRTEKQFGYLVGVGFIPINRYPGLAFYIQSPHTQGIALEHEIREFLQEIMHSLTEISNAEWQHIQMGLIGQLTEKDTSLGVKSQRFWQALCNQDPHFDQKQRLINAISACSLAQVTAFIEQYLVDAKNLLTLISSPDALTKQQIASLGQLTQLNDSNKFKLLY